MQLETKRIRELNILSILILVICCLFIGQLSIKKYFSSYLYWGIGFLIPFIILYIVLVIKKMEFSFILIIYVLQHFVYIENQGGLWNLLTFAIIIAYILSIKNRKNTFFFEEINMKILFYVLIVMHIIGMAVKSQMSLSVRLLETATFISYILMYFFVSRQIIELERLRSFFWICLIITAYMAIVCINQRYAFFFFDSPIFPLVINTPGYTSTNSYGTIGSGPLLGEYALGIMTIFAPFVLLRGLLKEIGIKALWMIILATLCYIILIITNNRSTFILFILMISVYLVIYISLKRINITMISFLISILFVSIALPSYLGLTTLIERIDLIDFQTISVKGILSGEVINRSNVFPVVLDRLVKESWFVGYGYGNIESNAIAWFGMLDEYVSDTHNLYFALPMNFGWFGAAAFILIIITVFIRLSKMVRIKNKSYMPLYLYATILGFLIFWPLFLIDEYKVNMLAKNNYQAIVWIWLGISNALVRTARGEIYNIKNKGN